MVSFAVLIFRRNRKRRERRDLESYSLALLIVSLQYCADTIKSNKSEIWQIQIMC
jgi:hypothetical protein